MSNYLIVIFILTQALLNGFFVYCIVYLRKEQHEEKEGLSNIEEEIKINGIGERTAFNIMRKDIKENSKRIEKLTNLIDEEKSGK